MSGTQTITLTEFLLARIAEDEADVIGHDFDYAYHDTGVSVCRHESHRWSGWSPTCWRAQVAARVLVECEAKRRIVEHCDFDHLAMSPGDPYVLQLLALPYADHPDFREEWKL